MSTGAYDAQGTKFYVGDTGSPGPSAAVTEIKSIKPPQGKRSWKDRTDLDSTAREGKPGLIDWGEMTLSLFWTPEDAVHGVLKAAFLNNTKKGFSLDFNAVMTGVHWDFSGYVTAFGQPSIDEDGDQMIDVTLHVDGAITVTG